MKDIIDGCIREDRVAQRILYDKYSKKMLGVCFRYAKDIMEAEDIMQEGFIKVFDKIGSFKHNGSFDGWVRRIMVNTAINKFKARRLDLEYKDEFNFDVEDEICEEPIDSMGYDELIRVINKLPDGYRTVFNLFAIDGYSHSDIANKLGIKESTSRTQYCKGRRCLIKLMNKK
jgi:RNA polymerase sigma-70 factor (ECF subfamily)